MYLSHNSRHVFFFFKIACMSVFFVELFYTHAFVIIFFFLHKTVFHEHQDSFL